MDLATLHRSPRTITHDLSRLSGCGRQCGIMCILSGVNVGVYFVF